MKRTYFAIVLFAITNILLAFSQHRWERNEILKFDGSGYYLFLPAAFIYQDLGEMKFYPSIDSIYRPSNDTKYYSLYKCAETHRYTNKYAIGVSIGEMPLFLAAHWYTKHYNTKYTVDGYSVPYQFSVGISNVLWSILGLIILGAFLRKYFSDGITALTLFIIGFGTNLYCYTNIEFGLSHGLEFMIFASILYYTERWYSTRKMKYSTLLGIFLGWSLITRPVDFLVLLVPLMWHIKPNGAKNRGAFFWEYKTHLLGSAIACLLVTSIQLFYWKYTTGHFIHFSYEEEGFNFKDPEIINGLFSFRKGWFVYTPIAFISFLGLFALYHQNKGFLFPVLAFYIPFIYVVFSWWNWWYGWGFGARAMIESYAILSIPLASLIYWLSKQKLLIRSLSIGIFGFFIWMNIYQTEQYNMSAIHGDNMSQQFYWRVWNKMHPSPDDWKYFGK